jgi:hypothetical protein
MLGLESPVSSTAEVVLNNRNISRLDARATSTALKNAEKMEQPSQPSQTDADEQIIGPARRRA